MANNYLQFSFVVDNLTPQERNAFTLELQRAEHLLNEDLEEWTEDDARDAELLSGLRFRDLETSVWFYSEESADPEGVAGLVGRALAAAGSSRVVGFAWAEFCDKLRADEFSGGGVVINRHGSVYWDAASWVYNTITAGGAPPAKEE